MGIMSEKKYAQLFQRLQSCCLNFRTFKKFFDSDKCARHISKRAEEQGGIDRVVRENISDRHIAALIVQGKLRIDACRQKGPVTVVAIEGVFRPFSGFDFNEEGPFTYPEIFVRVIIRDIGGPKYVVVTYYSLWEKSQSDETTEVNTDEIWK